MPEVFEVLIHAARRQLTVTTPYYVPSEAMHSALCAAGHRGVETRLVVPARNDSWIVAAASRSYYSDLIDAGVKIYEYEGGLLHAKTLTLDDDVTLLGSANLDRRSFDLNYESNILLQDAALTATILERQRSYIAGSRAIDAAEIEAWSVWRQIWNNSIAMLGPIL